MNNDKAGLLFGVFVGISSLVLAAWGMSNGSRQVADPPRTEPTSVEPKAARQVFTLPGPDSKRAEVAFYGANQLPQITDAALCADLRQQGDIWRKTTQRTEADDEGFKAMDEILVKAIETVCDPARPPRARLEAIGNAILYFFTGDGFKVEPSLSMGAVRLKLAALREARTWEDVVSTEQATHWLPRFSNDIEAHWAQRLEADFNRLSATICRVNGDKVCALMLLTKTARDYAYLGSQTRDEQHFNDTAQVLEEAESYLNPLRDLPAMHKYFNRLSSAYGYAGEAGRDAALVRKAISIAQTLVSALEPLKDGEYSEAHGDALNTLGANLGRFADGAPDRREALKRAIVVINLAIDHAALHHPDQDSWSDHVNLCASATELFEIDRDAAILDQAVSHGRRALAIARAKHRNGMLDPYDVAIGATRLAGALARKARHDGSLEKSARLALAGEAGQLLDEAEPAFLRLGTRPYLNLLKDSRAIADEVIHNPEPAKH